MKLFERRPLEMMYLQNSLMALIPAVLYMIVLGVVLNVFPLWNKVSTHQVTTIKELNSLEEEGYSNVKLSVKKATYLGYDYYVGNKLKGSYYYAILDDTPIVVLIEGKKRQLQIDDYVIKGKIIGNNADYEYIINNFSRDSGIGTDDLSNMFYGGIISEIDYPFIYTAFLYCLIIIPIMFTLGLIFANVIYVFYPYKHPLAKRLLAFGSNKEAVIYEIDSQMRNRMVMRTKHSIMTEEYVIIHTIFITEVIKIDYIKYISKHVETRKMIGFIKLVKYKLTISNPERMYFEYDFSDLVEVDKVIEELILLCPNLDDEVVGNWID